MQFMHSHKDCCAVLKGAVQGQQLCKYGCLSTLPPTPQTHMHTHLHFAEVRPLLQRPHPLCRGLIQLQHAAAAAAGAQGTAAADAAAGWGRLYCYCQHQVAEVAGGKGDLPVMWYMQGEQDGEEEVKEEEGAGDRAREGQGRAGSETYRLRHIARDTCAKQPQKPPRPTQAGLEPNSTPPCLSCTPCLTHPKTIHRQHLLVPRYSHRYPHNNGEKHHMVRTLLGPGRLGSSPPGARSQSPGPAGRAAAAGCGPPQRRCRWRRSSRAPLGPSCSR